MTTAIPTGKRAAYPAYKPSGVPWLGDVPEHWEVRRLKHIASVQFSSVDKHTIEDEEPVRLCNYVDVYYNDFIKEGIDFMAATATRSEIDRFQLRHGDVLVTKDSEAWDDIAVPAYVAEELDGVLCGYHLAHIRPDLRKVLGAYLFRAFRSRGVNDQFRVAANGITRFGLGKYWLDNGLFPVPPLDEQRAIAAFLDRETARIDALIEKKRRQIELLQEKRSALISHAVTKGLNPNAPMKDSGIEWLGQIPAHWKAVPLRRYLRVSSGDMISVNDFCEEGYPVLGGNGFRGYSDRWNTESDTIIIGRYGALCGNVRVTEERIWATEHAFRVIPLTTFCPKFLAAVIEALDLNRLSARTAQPGLNSEMVRNNVVGIPPISEQKAIADFVAAVTTRSDDLVSKIGKSIAALQEFRTALISAAVTGKIDVRREVSNG